MHFPKQRLKDAFFSATYIFCTRKYLAARLASLMCVQDTCEIDGKMPQILRLIRARPDLSGENGQYVLSSAALHQYPDLFRTLLEAGVPPDEKNGDGRTPLTLTGISGTPEIATMLLGKGAKIDMPDKWGKTALMYAASARPEMVELLLSQGASLHLRDDRGKTAVDYALAPPETQALTELHEKCRALVVTVKEKEDQKKREHEAYLSEGLPATRPIAVLRPLSLTRKARLLTAT